MLNRRGLCTGGHSDEAAVLAVERLLQEQLQTWEQAAGLVVRLVWSFYGVLSRGDIMCLGVWGDGPHRSFWLLDPSVWLKGHCKHWSSVPLLVLKLKCMMTLQTSRTVRPLES